MMKLFKRPTLIYLKEIDKLLIQTKWGSKTIGLPILRAYVDSFARAGGCYRTVIIYSGGIVKGEYRMSPTSYKIQTNGYFEAKRLIKRLQEFIKKRYEAEEKS